MINFEENGRVLCRGWVGGEGSVVTNEMIEIVIFLF